MKINFKKIIIYIAFWTLIVTPVLVNAQTFQWGNLVPCGQNDPTDCTPQDFFTLVFNAITALIFLGIAFSSIVIAYAGFLYINARGNQEQVKKATKIFSNVAIGLFLALLSYLLIRTITTALGLNTDVIPIDFS